MKKINMKIIASILVVLVFFSIFIPRTNANFFTDNDKDSSNEETTKTDIEKTIDKDDGGIFEKIIAKMIRWNCWSSLWFNY